MDRRRAAGPSGTAPWRLTHVDSAEQRVWLVPDAANDASSADSNLFYALPETPALATSQTGRPVFSLSLLLSRRPQIDDENILALVEYGALTAELSLALPSSAAQTTSIRPLYAQLVELALCSGAEVLATATASGAESRLSLSAQLSRDHACSALLATRGDGSTPLILRTRVHYRVAETRVTVHLAASWTDLHAHFQSALGAASSLTLAELYAQLDLALAGEQLKAWLVEPSGLESPLTVDTAAPMHRAFMKVSAALFERLTPDLDPAQPDNRFRLRDAAPPASTLDLRLSVMTDTRSVKELETQLEAVIAGPLSNAELEAHVQLTYMKPSAGAGASAAPTRVRSVASRAGTAVPLLRAGDKLASASHMLRPDATIKPNAHALLASNSARLEGVPAHGFAIDDLVLAPADSTPSRPPHLPRVDDVNAALYPDAADTTRYFYAPEYTLAAVDPAVDPAQSAFAFRFHEAGHDAAGKEVLEGVVTFTLRCGPSAASMAEASKRGVSPIPIPISGLSVRLLLPLLDAQNQPREIDLQGQTEDHGATVTVRVPLLNEYVRVAYGDLAIAGFQAKQARLAIAYTFEAWVPLRRYELALASSEKIAKIPVAYAPQQATALAERTHLDAPSLALRGVDADVAFKRERVLSPAARDAAALRPVPPRPGMPIRPQLEDLTRLEHILARQQYGQQVRGRRSEQTVFYPCNTFGAFYRQELAGQSVAVGCKNSFTLGQTEFKLYEPMALAKPHASYRLLRSLSQPGRFLVVPTEYRITRYAPSDAERAYRPIIYLYSSLDPADTLNDRCAVMAMLQADLPPWVRRELMTQLATLHHSPVVEFVTEIESQLSYVWSIASQLGGSAPQATKLWDGFQVALSTDLRGGLQLQAILTDGGITGEATFVLPDETHLTTQLRLDLRALTGPWASGPLERTRSGSALHLINRVEASVNLSDVQCVTADGSISTLAVDRTISPGAALDVEVPAAAAEFEPVYELGTGSAATLTEINSFVEDVHTSLVLVNLINYRNHALVKVDLTVRIAQVPGQERTVSTSEEQPVAEVDFALPLTTYLGPRTGQLRATKTYADGTISTSSWIGWDIAALGTVISVTWDLIRDGENRP